MKNAHVAHGLAYNESWGHLGSAENYITEHPLLRDAEPIVHEICHGVSLGLKITKKVPEQVTDYFDELNGRSRILGLVNEAHTFAIERHVLHRFGWLRHIRLHALMKEVYKTGYSGPALPYAMFLSIYRRALQEEATQGLVREAVTAVYRVAGVKVL